MKKRQKISLNISFMVFSGISLIIFSDYSIQYKAFFTGLGMALLLYGLLNLARLEDNKFGVDE